MNEKEFENEINESTIYDDDRYINDCSSLKRKMTIIEKIVIIIASLLCLPIGLFFCNLLPGDLQEYLKLSQLPNNLLYIFIWLFIFFILMFTEFHSKNFSLYKGVITSSLRSFTWTILLFAFAGSIVSLVNKEGASYWFFIALFSAAIYAVILLIVRVVVFLVDKYQEKAVMIIGPKDDAEKLARKLMEKNNPKLKVRFVFYEINGDLDDIVFKKFCYCNQILLLDTLKVTTKEKFLLYFNSCFNKDIYLCYSYFDVISVSPSTKDIGGYLSLEQKPLRIDFVEGAVKRVFDICCSLLLLILTLPVWIVIPIAIKIDSKGPVFFRQERYTKDLKTFKIFKFRSMYIDADPNKLLQKGNDARVTRVGKFIRAFRIDEIPQVLNVLKGDMSFVGPRAWMHSVVDENVKNNPEFKYRFNVKAGITGLQQVKTKAGCSEEQKLRYDLYYIANYSIVFDIKILFMTVKAVLDRSMSEGVDTDSYTFQEFLEFNNHEYNQHKDYIRVLNHKRYIDPKTGFIVPLDEINKNKKIVNFMNKNIKKKK